MSLMLLLPSTSVVSDSVKPQRRQPTRLPRPWDSPGKNTGAGCHCLLQCMKVKSESEVAQSCPTLSDPMDYSPPGSSVHGIFQARVNCNYSGLGTHVHLRLIHVNFAVLAKQDWLCRKLQRGQIPSRSPCSTPVLFHLFSRGHILSCMPPSSPT